METEESIIDAIRRQCPPHEFLDLGIGDDAAIFHLPSGRRGLVSTDMLMDGVHFDSQSTPLTLIGRKALAVNLSDIAAMGGRPLFALLSVALPKNGAKDTASQLMEGLQALAGEFNVAIAGGDTNVWNGPLVINVTILGAEVARSAILRSGARIGDKVMVTGNLGGSLKGRHLAFTPRVREAQVLAQRFELSSLTDISDGLASDLRDLCNESNVGIALIESKIPISPDADKDAPLRSAMCDGEDFELCFTVGANDAAAILREQPLSPLIISEIGDVIGTPGLFWQGPDGTFNPCIWRGFKH